MDLWSQWWASLQPDWRVKRDGRFIREGTGDFAGVRVGGINGTLNLVWSLAMWLKGLDRGLVTDGGREEWLEAVRDVAWALRS